MDQRHGSGRRRRLTTAAAIIARSPGAPRPHHSDSPPRRRRRALLAAGALAVAVAVPSALAAAPATQQPGQRIDLKVLLLSSKADDPWKAALTREGIPYDTVASTGTTSVLTDAKLADYTDNHAKYQAVVVSNLVSDADQAVLAKFERTFGIRQLSDDTFPSAAHGLNAPTVSAPLDGVLATLTPAGKQAFPYLKGDVPIANVDPAVDEAFGWEATPVGTQDFTTLVA